MRLGDAEREQLFELLSRHAAAGRLTFDELEHRVARVAAAQTREEAAAVLSDLPALPAVEHRGATRGNLLGRRSGHGEVESPAPDWTPTQERFRDPRSGRLMRVWVDGSGARHYVPDTEP